MISNCSKLIWKYYSLGKDLSFYLLLMKIITFYINNVNVCRPWSQVNLKPVKDNCIPFLLQSHKIFAIFVISRSLSEPWTTLQIKKFVNCTYCTVPWVSPSPEASFRKLFLSIWVKYFTCFPSIIVLEFFLHSWRIGWPCEERTTSKKVLTRSTTPKKLII